jgi:DNA-binding transcriptional regulator YiaG
MTIIQALKNEISRSARKEINKAMQPLKRVNATQRSLIAKLRRDLSELQQSVKEIQRSPKAAGAETKAREANPETDTDGRRGVWFTSKGIRSLRARLGITQTELGKLAGVSAQSVVNWEKSTGKIAFRQQKTAKRILEIRNLTKKTARRALAS